MSKLDASSMILFGVVVLASSVPARVCGQARGQIAGQVIRVIDDAATGDRWLLMRDASDPGGPGRMVRATSTSAGSTDGFESEAARIAAVRAANRVARPAMAPVIRAGDAVIVEEHSTVVDARLEATALGSAGPGSEFEARLKIGGKAIRVVALGPGRAVLESERKAHP